MFGFGPSLTFSSSSPSSSIDSSSYAYVLTPVFLMECWSSSATSAVMWLGYSPTPVIMMSISVGLLLGPELSLPPPLLVFYGFRLGCFWLNIGHNFVKHARLIIFSCPNIVSSIIGIVILCFHFVHCTVCPIIVFFTWVISPVIGLFTQFSFVVISAITIHYWNNVR